MPSPQEMAPTEFNDFTGGLYERNTDRECPQNGLLELMDAYPQPRGGLRAFMRFEPVSQTGLPTNSLILGVWKLRPPEPQGRLRIAVLVLNTGASTHDFRVYSIATHDTSGVLTDRQQLARATWNQDFSITGVEAIDTSIQMVSYRTDALGYRCYVNAPVQQTGGDLSTQAIWRLGSTVTTSTASSGAQLAINSSRWPDSMAVHQARLLYTEIFSQLHNRIVYTKSGTDSTSTNFFDPIGEKAGAVTWMDPAPPSYLTIAKSETGIVLAQGDMLNPQLRQMNFSHHFFGSFPCATDMGTAYMVPNDGFYLFTQGGVQKISPQLYGTPMNPGFYPGTFSVGNSAQIKVSQPTLSGDFLFAGKGYVLDMRTQAWFRTSFGEVGGGAKNFTTDATFYRTFFSTNDLYDGSKQLLYHGYYLENEDGSVDTWNPASSYTFTLPLVYNPSQQTNVREVEYHLDAFNTGGSVTVEVITPHNETKTWITSLKSAGPQKVTVQVNAKDDWVKIRTTVAADPKRPAPNEAPYLERMFVYSQKGTRYGVG